MWCVKCEVRVVTQEQFNASTMQNVNDDIESDEEELSHDITNTDRKSRRSDQQVETEVEESISSLKVEVPREKICRSRSAELEEDSLVDSVGCKDCPRKESPQVINPFKKRSDDVDDDVRDCWHDCGASNCIDSAEDLWTSIDHLKTTVANRIREMTRMLDSCDVEDIQAVAECLSSLLDVARKLVDV
ncbi:hypothetical protein GEMRC1_012913 [Eukaryota sp. GEM-RC1]